MSDDATAPTVRLPNGASMPRLGLGTYPMDDAEAERAVATAIQSGYRLIDTAALYGNEVGVGRGLAASGVPREELFVQTKLVRDDHGADAAKRAFERSAQRLGVDHLDLLLIHWPNPDLDRYVETWKALVELLGDGRLKAAGVSNFKPHHLERIVDATGVVPDVNQIETDPTRPRADDLRVHRELGIVPQAWSPLGGQGTDVREDDVVRRVAERHGRSPSQVVLRWHVQREVVPVPKSSDPDRQRENLAVFDFELTAEDLDELRELDRGGAGITDSDETGY